MSKTRQRTKDAKGHQGRIAEQEGKSVQDPGAAGDRAEKEYGSYPLSGMPEGFGGAVGVRAGQDSGEGDSQSGDMGQGIEIGRAGAAAHPQPLLAGGLEAGIVSLALGTQGIGSLEIEAAAIDGKPVVCGDGLVFGTASVLLSVVPTFCGCTDRRRSWSDRRDSRTSGGGDFCFGQKSFHPFSWQDQRRS